MRSPTLNEIAKDFALWGQYVDPQGLDSREAFEAMGLDGRLAFMEKCGMKDEEHEDSEREEVQP